MSSAAVCYCWHSDDANHTLYVRATVYLDCGELLKSVLSDSAPNVCFSSPNTIHWFCPVIACLVRDKICSCVYLQLPRQCLCIM